jgi:hypothetical protein
MPRPATSVHPIHFEDYGGAAFARLVFAYHWRSGAWRSLEWYGHVGSDLGRDIWGVRENEGKAGESVCIQCVNRKQLSFAKVAADVTKIQDLKKLAESTRPLNDGEILATFAKVFDRPAFPRRSIRKAI